MTRPRSTISRSVSFSAVVWLVLTAATAAIAQSVTATFTQAPTSTGTIDYDLTFDNTSAPGSNFFIYDVVVLGGPNTQSYIPPDFWFTSNPPVGGMRFTDYEAFSTMQSVDIAPGLSLSGFRFNLLSAPSQSQFDYTVKLRNRDAIDVGTVSGTALPSSPQAVPETGAVTLLAGTAMLAVIMVWRSRRNLAPWLGSPR